MSFDQYIKDFIGDAMKDNAKDLAEMPIELVKAGLNTAMSEIIPDKYMSPVLNNMRMQYAAEALKHTAMQKERMDRIMQRIKDSFFKVLEKALDKAL